MTGGGSAQCHLVTKCTNNKTNHCHKFLHQMLPKHFRSYFGGGHSRLRDQVLVDAGACDGSFAAVGGQGASGGKPRGEGCAGVLLGNLLDYQHFGHHLFATRRVFWNGKQKRKNSELSASCLLEKFHLIWTGGSYPTLQHGEPLVAAESQAFQLFQG